ncbi:MAG: ScpA family protein [Candidatus Anstonellaceae archaeon]
MPRRPAAEEEEDDSQFSESAAETNTMPARKKPSNDSEEAGIEDSGDKHVDVSRFSSEDLKLEKIVAYPTWREMLLDLVASKKLDPWNIDIVDVASGYIDKIKKMEMLDLRIPANLILAAAILIRFKSDALRFEEEAQMPVEETYVAEGEEPEVIPVLELKTRIPPKRMVTLDELLLAMEKVFEEQKKREDKAQKIEIPSVINIQLPEMNIEQRMAEVYELVLERKDSEGLATFSSLLDERTPLEIIATLLPVLHLVQDRKLSIFQEQFLGEIFIRVREETIDEKKKSAG